jgi:myosin-5
MLQVSGESGAGKTETVKILMGHCAFIASTEGNLTIDKLLKASPLLESFGNAKTARNDNSSRFGKFSQLEFDACNTLVGSKCIHYLLEKSRVVSQSSLERNYHVIYQLLAAPDDVKQRLFLSNKSVSDFLYTSNGDCHLSVIEGVSDQDRYKMTTSALELLGVHGPLRQYIESALVGILFLGLVSFVERVGNSDAVDLSGDTASTEAVHAACELLGVEQSAFSLSTISRTLDVEGEKLKVPLTLEQVCRAAEFST